MDGTNELLEYFLTGRIDSGGRDFEERSNCVLGIHPGTSNGIRFSQLKFNAFPLNST